MSVFIKNNTTENDREKLSYHKTGYSAEIVYIIIGVLIMLFPIFVDMGHPAPTASVIIVGFLFALIGVAVALDTRKKNKRKEKAYNEGKKFRGVVTGVQHTVRRARGRRNDRRKHFYCVECEVIDPETNEKYLYTSHYVGVKLYGYEGKEVTVCVDMDDRSNYYVDLVTLLDGEE